MDGKNDHIVQSSISMIVKTEDICSEYPRNLPRKSLKSAQNIPEICPERLGDGQQVPDSLMESPSIWVSFLSVPKSLVRRFFLGYGSPCNTHTHTHTHIYFTKEKNLIVFIMTYKNEYVCLCLCVSYIYIYCLLDS
jgi:hypothetical protein